MNWISFEDEWPEDGELLISDGVYVRFGHSLNGNYISTGTYYSNPVYGATHWQYLPEPSKEQI